MSVTTARTGSGLASRKVGSSSMPTDTKNSTAKASRSGSASAAAWWLMSDSPTTSAGEERAERERDAEDARGDERDAEGDGQDGEREQLARALAGDDQQQPRDQAQPRRRP